MNKEQLIERWQEEFAFCEEQEKNNLKNKEYIVAHNHAVRKEQIRLFINDIKNLNIPDVSTSVCSMKGKGFCPHEFDNGKCDYAGTCTNKQTDC